MDYERFFWLHVKKSAGFTTRKLLKPYYKEVDRGKKPITFIQATPQEYNDVLNNFRVVLGDYQFKRVLFAKKFLYSDDWNSICSFAFSREPIDRCISMFYYLHHKNDGFLGSLSKAYRIIKNWKRIGLSVKYDFDLFLELIDIAHFNSNSIYDPVGLHFSTHTAPMFTDITDNEGNVLLTKVYRLEDLNRGIEQVFQLCGLNYSNKATVFRNKNTKRGFYEPSKSQRIKIVQLYEKDFDIYEKAADALHK